MSPNIDKLRKNYEDAEAKMFTLQAKKDEAMQDVRDKYMGQLREAIDKAAAAQKELCNAEAAAALVGRDDAAAVAENLGLTLPE